MSHSEIPTLKPARVPVTLVIGGTDRMIGVVSEAAISAQVLVADCSASDAATTAAEMRPLVLVMPRDVYEVEREAMDSLARDVRARILILDEDHVDTEELELQLVALMNEAENQRPSWAGELG
ncbi:MAG: hypothetical protein FJ096_18000 [Deltaproteobacteria bacterium]|nr:hypothetical protein [Deltaproteobacteria bacterium]